MAIRKNYLFILLFSVILFFFGGYTYQAITNMRTVPFNEFDEAHRAENAKRMKESGSFLVPVSGSVYDRVVNLRMKFEGDQFKFLYYHLERPPLVYDLMILSTYFWGGSEFAYRFPSFILGMISILVFIIFVKVLKKKINLFAFILGLICLLTSADLWLSSQYAQLDTGLTTFLFITLMGLIAYAENKKKFFLIISAISFGLAFLSKGQPTVFIAPVIVYLLYIKKLSFKDVLYFGLLAVLILSPWVIYLCFKFGLGTFLGVFSGFAFSTTSTDIMQHQAPVFWYARWWLETLKPGWGLFLAFFAIDVIRKKLDWRKKTLLIYIFFNFLMMSFLSDKLWWYILPLVPAICFYVYLAAEDFLVKRHFLINVSIVLIILSRSPQSGTSNTMALSYGIFFIVACFYLLYGLNISNVHFQKNELLRKIETPTLLFVSAIVFSLSAFYFRFPDIIPYHWNMKDTAIHFSQLPGYKCLWIYDVPTESVLFYSNTGEVYTYENNVKPFGHCINYIITAQRLPNFTLEFRQGNMRLYRF